MPAAGADAADDARAVADRFLSALLAGDVETLCGLLSPNALAIVLAPAGTSYLVDDLLYSAFSE